MIKEYQHSKVHPCTMRFQGVLCHGTAILYQDTYTCNRCGWQWNQDGTPKERTNDV
jgi:hypothetical protein